MMAHSRHYARARRNMQNQVASVLLLAGAVLTTLGWTGEAWGQVDVRRVGILSFTSIADDPTWELWFDGPFRRNLADEGWIEGNDLYPVKMRELSEYVL